ncbi:hypothetical protein C8R45DRAFT_1044208, partial [Mycena sanguinolenta]
MRTVFICMPVCVRSATASPKPPTRTDRTHAHNWCASISATRLYLLPVGVDILHFFLFFKLGHFFVLFMTVSFRSRLCVPSRSHNHSG